MHRSLTNLEDVAATSLCFWAFSAFIIFSWLRRSWIRRVLGQVPGYSVARDVLIILLLQGVAAIILASAQHPGQLLTSPTKSAVMLYIAGFTISGCLAPARRWRHMALVTGFLWLINMISLGCLHLFPNNIEGLAELIARPGGAMFRMMMLGIGVAIFLGTLMAVGGALSCLLRRDH